MMDFRHSFSKVVFQTVANQSIKLNSANLTKHPSGRRLQSIPNFSFRFSIACRERILLWKSPVVPLNLLFSSLIATD